MTHTLFSLFKRNQTHLSIVLCRQLTKHKQFITLVFSPCLAFVIVCWYMFDLISQRNDDWLIDEGNVDLADSLLLLKNMNIKTKEKKWEINVMIERTQKRSSTVWILFLEASNYRMNAKLEWYWFSSNWMIKVERVESKGKERESFFKEKRNWCPLSSVRSWSNK